MGEVAIIGGTGFTGSHILTCLLDDSRIASVLAFSRVDIAATHPKLKIHPDHTSANWPSVLALLSPAPAILFSALAYPLRFAGTLEAQRAIEYGYQLELAKAAKAGGVRVFVGISSAGASASSKSAFMKMKWEIEHAVEELDFEYAVFLRPFFIMGKREKKRGWDGAVQSVVKVSGIVSGGLLTSFWTSRVEDLAGAAVGAGMAALKAEAPERIWVVEGSEIQKLGREYVAS